MEDTNTAAPIEAISRDCKVGISIVTSSHSPNVTVDVVDDGRVRVRCGAMTLFMAAWDAELLSRELLYAAVRAQHRAEATP